MERVETLCERLREQLSQHASADELLLTVQMLQSELQHIKSTEQEKGNHSAVSFHIASAVETRAEQPAALPVAEERVLVFLDVNESEVERELEEIKMNAESKNKVSQKNKPPMLFDPIEDTPTLIHQKNILSEPKKELNEIIAPESGVSLNDTLREQKIEISESLKDDPIKDLKKAIGINDRFLYISELFRGDEVMYERSIKTINGFAIYPEAEYWIKRELKLKLGWDDKNEIVKQFDQLVRRRFSFI